MSTQYGCSMCYGWSNHIFEPRYNEEIDPHITHFKELSLEEAKAFIVKKYIYDICTKCGIISRLNKE